MAVAARYLKGSMLLQAVESKYINFAASGVNAAKRRERHRKKLDEQARECEWTVIAVQCMYCTDSAALRFY